MEHSSGYQSKLTLHTTPDVPPPPLDTAAEGIFIGPTNGLVGHDWHLFVNSFDCGWL